MDRERAKTLLPVVHMQIVWMTAEKSFSFLPPFAFNYWFGLIGNSVLVPHDQTSKHKWHLDWELFFEAVSRLEAPVRAQLATRTPSLLSASVKRLNLTSWRRPKVGEVYQRCFLDLIGVQNSFRIQLC